MVSSSFPKIVPGALRWIYKPLGIIKKVSKSGIALYQYQKGRNINLEHLMFLLPPQPPKKSTMSSIPWSSVSASAFSKQSKNRAMCASGKCDPQELCSWEHRFGDTKRAIELLRAHCAMITSSAIYKPPFLNHSFFPTLLPYFPKKIYSPADGLRISSPTKNTHSTLLWEFEKTTCAIKMKMREANSMTSLSGLYCVLINGKKRRLSCLLTFQKLACLFHVCAVPTKTLSITRCGCASGTCHSKIQ